MTCVILQPSYIPWRGVFHQIDKADVFIFLDDVPYDRRSWRNRNRIKTQSGPRWLTVPVFTKGTRACNVPICQIEIDWTSPWPHKHLEAIRHAYHDAPYFEWYWPRVEEFLGRRPRLLADLTIGLTVDIAADLGLSTTRFLRSSEIGVAGRKTERLLNLLRTVGATHYVSGPSARDYIDESKFIEAGVTLEYMTYDYPTYPQLHGPFDPFVSVLDLILMTGDSALFSIRGGEPIGVGLGRGTLA